MHKIFFYTVLYTVDGCSSEKKSHSKQPGYSGSIPIHARHPIWGEMLAQPISIVMLYIEMKAKKKKKIETYASQYRKKRRKEKK
jgi:hypothetical protein